MTVVTELKKFEHMLQMRKFILSIDSSCLKYLGTLKNFKCIFARWQLYLREFDFQVKHRAGTSHTNTDVLSRHEDVLNVTPELSADEVIIELTTPRSGKL